MAFLEKIMGPDAMIVEACKQGDANTNFNC